MKKYKLYFSILALVLLSATVHMMPTARMGLNGVVQSAFMKKQQVRKGYFVNGE